MRYGFKAKAERIAADARKTLGLGPLEALDTHAYAESLNVVILDWNELSLTQRCVHQLLIVDNESWSGMTIKLGEATAILVNPKHVQERQRNTMMHELAHLILGHVAVRVDISSAGIMLLSEYSDEDEGEADWLAATLLLPRDMLMHHRGRGLSTAQIAKLMGVSLLLCDWRVRMTGVDVQMRRARAGV